MFFFHQTESSVPSAEPSGRWGNRCGADFHTSKPSLGAPASGPDATQAATGSTAAEAPPGPCGGRAMHEELSVVLRNKRRSKEAFIKFQ